MSLSLERPNAPCSEQLRSSQKQTEGNIYYFDMSNRTPSNSNYSKLPQPYQIKPDPVYSKLPDELTKYMNISFTNDESDECVGQQRKRVIVKKGTRTGTLEKIEQKIKKLYQIPIPERAPFSKFSKDYANDSNCDIVWHMRESAFQSSGSNKKKSEKSITTKPPKSGSLSLPLERLQKIRRRLFTGSEPDGTDKTPPSPMFTIPTRSTTPVF